MWRFLVVFGLDAFCFFIIIHSAYRTLEFRFCSSLERRATAHHFFRENSNSFKLRYKWSCLLSTHISVSQEAVEKTFSEKIAMEKDILDRTKNIHKRLSQLKDSLEFDEKKARVVDIEHEMVSNVDFWNVPEKTNAIVAELKGLKSVLKPLEEAWRALEDLETMIEMAEDDDSFLDEIPTQLDELEKDLEHLELYTLLSGTHDNADAILSINARDGGTDANDWAEMLLRMYINWGQMHGYKIEILDRLDNEEAGINSAVIAIRGPLAYGYLKGEAGMHRLVRISPFNSEGKRQTSFAAVDVAPDVENSTEIEIRDADIREDVFRASGAGGQHVNKTSSAIRLTHLPTGIVVQCQNERSQHQNRAAALKMLRARLARIEEEKREQEQADKYNEKAKVGFGSQIRSYFLHPDQRVKDARTGYYMGNFNAVLDGNIQGFLDAYLRWYVKGEQAGDLD